MNWTCPRCIGGFVITQHNETRCLNCGWCNQPPNETPPDNHLHRWESVTCSRCHEKQAMKGWEVCQSCRKKWARISQPVSDL